MRIHRPFLVVTALLLALLVSLQAMGAHARPTEPEREATVPPARGSLHLLADFEGGLPGGFFQYNGGGSSVAAFQQDIPDSSPIALPGQVGNNGVLSSTFSIGDFGGFGVDFAPNPQDWAAFEGVSFWFFGTNSGLAYQAEIFDNRSNPASDTAERFDFTFTDDFSGWRHVSIPFRAFTRAVDFQPPGAPNDGLTLTEMWGFAFPLPLGTSNLYLDEVALYTLTPLAEFEGGLPGGFFQYNGGGSSVAAFQQAIPDSSPIALPGQVGNNGVLSGTFSVGDFGGFGVDFAPNPQDWAAFEGVNFWFFGTNSGLAYQAEIFDNRSNPASDTAERFDFTFTDDFSGWRHVSIPFRAFTRAVDFQPPGAPNDGLTLTEMWGFAFPLPLGASSLYLDQFALVGSDAPIQQSVAFDAFTYEVDEGGAALITATLNMTATYPVTVSYATADGTATGGVDYTSAAGTLVFPPGSLSQSFAVSTGDDADEEEDETILLALSNPVSVTLGVRDAATLTIRDNDAPAPSGKALIVDDFEGGLPSGQDGNGVGIGFVTFRDGGSSVAITTTTTPPAPVPGTSGPNAVVRMDSNVVAYAGFTHAFEDVPVATWVSQDWSGYEGFRFWLYGTGSGVDLFVDILDNRNPGSTSDDAERFTYGFSDDVAGWQLMQIPFDDFQRKEIGNGAPNDGLNLTQVHGWAFGSLGSGGPQSHFLDDVGLAVRVTTIDDFESGLPSGQDGNGVGIGFVTWGDGGSSIAITTTTTPPAPVPGTSGPNAVVRMDSNVVAYAGFTHAFEDAPVTNWISQDWSQHEGLCFWLYGTGAGVDLFVDILDNRNPGSTSDDAERFTYGFSDDVAGWRLMQIPFDDFQRKEIGNGAPNDGLNLTQVHGWAFGSLGSGGPQSHFLDQVTIYGNTGGGAESRQVQFSHPSYLVAEGASATFTVTLNVTATEPVSVSYITAESLATPGRDFTPVSGTLRFEPGTTQQNITLPTLQDGKYEGDERLILHLREPVSATLGFRQRAVLLIADDEAADPLLLDDFEGFHRFHARSGPLSLSATEVDSGSPLAVPGQGLYEGILRADHTTSAGGAAFTRTLVEPQDWRTVSGLNFWYYGTGSGDAVTVQVLDNQAATTGDLPPAQWQLLWSDEFDGAAGTFPDRNHWTPEIGDGALNANPGWGNSELQSYTNSPDNAAMDGAGNLVLTVRAVASPTQELLCWYGPCEYTSARLISWHKVEAKHGRLEARLQVPQGSGLWPAFWALGTDIGEVGWPQTGEIDVMEFVGRQPLEVFGTLHGPGYSGGQSYGGTYTFGQPVYEQFHTFAVEWQPGEIRWYVDDILYHTATPADVAPNQWVFDHPFFLILNVAVGGNFGGPVGDETTFPQRMTVDYVRVYGAPDTAERWETTITDDVAGWQQRSVPFSALTRSATQPPNAPNDGLGLDAMWGYGYSLTNSSNATFYLDQVRVGAATSPVRLNQLDGSSRTGFGLPWLALAGVVALLVARHTRRG